MKITYFQENQAMSENKNITKSLDTGIDIINAGGFEKDQKQRLAIEAVQKPL